MSKEVKTQRPGRASELRQQVERLLAPGPPNAGSESSDEQATNQGKSSLRAKIEQRMRDLDKTRSS